MSEAPDPAPAPGTGASPAPVRFSARRLRAMMAKEFAQIARDPSTFLIALAMPLLLLFLFGYAVSLDTQGTRVAVVVEDSSAPALALSGSYAASPYFHTLPMRNRGQDRRTQRAPPGFGKGSAGRAPAPAPERARGTAAQYRHFRGQPCTGRVPVLGGQ